MPDKVTQVRSIPWKLGLNILVVLSIAFFVSPVAAAQGHAKNEHSHSADQKALGGQISGMYTFTREGEFVQITVEEGRLSGFVSRYGDRESDKDAFLDQFFSKGSIDGNRITFTTKPVHGTWFEFAGEVSRGSGKTPDQEGYWVIRGTLKQYDEDELKHVTSKSREITFKSFPQDAQADQPK
jgi:hypothetical protein